MNNDSWRSIKFKNIVKKVSLTDHKIKKSEYLPEGKIPVIDQGANRIGGYINNEKKALNCDLPVVIFGDHTKRVKYIDRLFAPGADGVTVLSPSKYYNPRLLAYFTEALTYKIPDKGYARHYKYIEKKMLPLPPIPEQRAIVEKIEQLFSELDNGIESLEKAQEQIDSYRQSVLKKAFEGVLTKEWRNEQDDLPSPDKMLEEIKAEKKKKYQKKIEQWKNNVKKWRSAKGLLPEEFPEIKKSKYYLYIIKDNRGNTYSGVVNNLRDKWKELKDNTDSGPLTLYYYEENKRKGDAKERLEFIQSKKGQKWLGKISKEKEQILNKFSKKPRKPRKPKEVSPLTDEEIADLPDLPEEWGYIKLNNCAEIIMGNSPPSSTYNTEKIGLPFFQGKTEFGDIYPKVKKWCSKPNKIASKNDVLVTVRAPVGSTNIADTKCCIGRGLSAIRYKKPYYILYYFRHIEDKIKAESGGTTFESITKSYLKNIPIPICSYSEQSKIVNVINYRLTICDKLEKDIKQSLEKAEKLRQSILNKAFEGQLLTDKEIEEAKQSSDWEPADKLMEKIKKQKNRQK